MFACLACGEYCAFPRYAFGRSLPWRCSSPSCRATHSLTLSSYDEIQNIRLVGRVFMPTGVSLEGSVHTSLGEATAAINANAPRAGCIMLRRTVEQFCANLGGTGNLTEKIDQLRDAKRITPLTANGFHAVRFLGNDAAHLELKHFDDITMDDAVEAHGLVVKLLATRPEP